MLAGRSTTIASCVAVTLLAVGPAAADGVLRYQGVLQGEVVATGNALGLSKAAGTNAPGTLGSIGTFIAAAAAAVDGTYPAGTTSDWTLNGSTAVLDLPDGAEVIYAELVWGGSYDYGGENLASALDDAPTLEVGGLSIMPTPDPTTALTVAATGDATTFRYYVRSAEVTTFVSAHGAGTYRLSRVPATQGDTVDALNAAGWALVVVVGTDDGPPRAVRLSIGGGFVEGETAQDYEFTGLCPIGGDDPGRVVIAALEGDAAQQGDQVRTGASLATLTELTGANNVADNFFASQINDGAGALDTRGSMGTRNHDAASATNVSGGRQGWDITTVALADGSVASGQDAFAIRVASTGDAVVTALAAVELEARAAWFAPSSPTLVPATVVGTAPATLTVALTNQGVVAAEDVTLTLPSPSELTVTALEIDGQPVVAADLAAGVPLGTIAAGATTTVTITLSSATAGAFSLAPRWSYAFVGCAGGGSTVGEAAAEPVTLTVTAVDGGVDAGVGGSDAGAPGVDDGGGGCGCGSSRAPAGDGALAVAVLGLIWVLTRRRI